MLTVLLIMQDMDNLERVKEIKILVCFLIFPFVYNTWEREGVRGRWDCEEGLSWFPPSPFEEVDEIRCGVIEQFPSTATRNTFCPSSSTSHRYSPSVRNVYEHCRLCITIGNSCGLNEAGRIFAFIITGKIWKERKNWGMMRYLKEPNDRTHSWNVLDAAPRIDN